MSTLRAAISKLAGLRAGELRLALPAFAVLFMTVAAHTTLETARDAVFLAMLPARDLNLVYVALAGVTLVVTFFSTKLTLAIGRRNALVASLLGVAVVALVFFFLPRTPKTALALYLFSGVEGAMLVPQFWLLADDLFTVAQARRLFGSITSGGVVGGVAGAASAALIVHALPVKNLLPMTAILFVRSDAADEDRVSTVLDAPASPPPDPRRSPFRDNPFLARIAALVSLSTAAVLVIDYLFKSSAARHVPPESLGFFFARYYAVMNAVSLVVQVAITGRLVRRVGVIGASAITPFLLLAAGVTTALQGGFVLALCLKTVDGGLRYSLNRVATELLYLPVPAGARQQAKGFIDSALARIVQAVTAIGLYFLAVHWFAGTRLLATIVVVLCAGWLAVALTLRGTYLDLFRNALTSGSLDPDPGIRDLDMTSAEALVQAMASPDPGRVVAAMAVLASHGRAALIPALILHHDSPAVLIRALDIFGRSTRDDWVPLAERLLASTDDDIAAAAVRALSKAGRVELLEHALQRPSTCVRSYIAFYRALHDTSVDLSSHPLIQAVMQTPGEDGRAARRALLGAVCDAPDERATSLLLVLASLPEIDDDVEALEQLGAAIATLKSERFIPLCLERLAKRKGRAAFRDALVAIGEPALDALEARLHDEQGDPHVRLHTPRSISRFGSQRAADILSAQLVTEKRGAVRYKVLRALGHLVAHHDVHVDTQTIDKEATKNVEEYLRLLSLRVALSARTSSTKIREDAAKQVLLGLLDDKLAQSMERSFRLLQIAHKREDIETVHAAARSANTVARANAGEFLDVLLVRHDQQRLRRLLRIVVDDANDRDGVERARAELPTLVHTYGEALRALLDDKDEVLVALAAQHALGLDDEGLRQAVAKVKEKWPSIQATSELLFGKPLAGVEVAHG
jgi:AAA family ATP:ADP antiporter